MIVISLAFGCAADDEPDSNEDALLPSDKSAEVAAAPGLVSPARRAELLRQITVYDEDGLDHTAPDELQIRAPRGKEAWVLDGAQALVRNAGGDPSDLSTALQAQRLMADMAHADATLLVSVASVAPAEPPANESLHRVVYTRERTIHGVDAPERFEARVRANGLCGGGLPEPGSKWLAHVRMHGDIATLSYYNPLKAVTDGVIANAVPLTVRVESLELAAVAADRKNSP